MSVQVIHLTMMEFTAPDMVYMVENDTGHILRMVLDDVTLSGDETGLVSVKHPDGTFATVPATIEAETNSFLADMEDALTVYGVSECQLKVTSSGSVASSFCFKIYAQKDTGGNDS